MMVRGLGLIILSMILFGAVFAQEQQPLQKVTLQLKWKHQFQFAGYYAAIEKGFYKEAGLEVELKEAQSGIEPASEVFKGNADFGITTADILILRSEGYKGVLLASIFQHSAQILIAARSSGIDHVQQLVDKRIAMEPHAADLITYMNDEGVSLNEVELYSHSFDVSSLLNGEVDAMTAYISDEPYLLNQEGFEHIIIDPRMGGIDFYGDVLFTTEEMVEQNPDLVQKFTEASLKGWQYAMENPEEITNVIYGKYSKRHSKEHLLFEAQKMQRLIMADVVEIGYSNPGRWQRILEIYKEQNMLASAITLDGLFLSDYVNTPNSFPWKLLYIFGISLVVVASATLFYYNTARRLKTEMAKRYDAQERLIESEKMLRESNAAKDKFFSILAHDLRNPFSAIMGLTDLMILDAKEEENTENLENLKIVKEASIQVLELLNNLLIWSRTQVGNIEYTPEVFDLSEQIKKNIAVVSSQAAHKNISIDAELSKEIPAFCDRNMFSTIMLNLLTNAIKFTPEKGRVTVGVNATKEEIKIFVKDNGIGMREEDLGKLFMIETKYTREGTNSEKGSGLGLLLCKEFIEMHKGRIWAESEFGKGSTFHITLPRFNTY